MKEKEKLLNWSISIITIPLSSMKFWLWRTGDKSLRVKEKFIGKQLISSDIHPDIINKYFCSITSDPEYIAPAPIDIPNGARIPKIPLQVVTSFLSRLKRTAVARMSSHTGFLEISPMILPLLLPMCLTARCDNIKYHPLGRWQTSSLYQRNLH